MKNFNLPSDYKPFSDKYFLRAKEVLERDNLNPIVKAQIFIRSGNCKVYGIDEAIAILAKYANTSKLKIFALQEGTEIAPCETVMTVEGPIQEIIALETMYLGTIAGETSIQNDKRDIDFNEVEKNMRSIVDLVGDRTISYFGARHWRWDADALIAKACFRGGAKFCSTDIGAEAIGQKGVGTIPHALECIYHWKYGIKRAVVEATKAFDKYIDKAVPRIALIDYANREISDSLRTIEEVPNLYGIRVDTCGENVMQGSILMEDDEPYMFSRGVSILGVYMLNSVIRKEGDYKIILSSGFGNPEKVQAFIDAEEVIGERLFDSLGVGGVYESRIATMDIIEVDSQEIHKVGRPVKPNSRLERVI